MEINPSVLAQVDTLKNPNSIRLRGTSVKLGESGETFKGFRVTAVANQDFPSLATTVVGGLDVTVTGIALGDVVLGVAPNVDPGDDFTFQGTVTATNTVRVTGRNNTTGTVDLPNTVDWVIVWLDLT